MKLLNLIELLHFEPKRNQPLLQVLKFTQDFSISIQSCFNRYDARSRVALYRVLYWLEIPQSTMEAFETSLASSLLATRKDGALKPSRNTLARWAKVGAVAIGGGAAIALTGKNGCFFGNQCFARLELGQSGK